MSLHDPADSNGKVMAEEIEKGDVGTGIVDSEDLHLRRKVLWKLDTRHGLPSDLVSSVSSINPRYRILPVLAVLFLCSFLDRTNVGNARLYNLEADLGMSNLQYNQGLAVFYATYIARSVTHVQYES
jgi:hypothetical protein